MELETDEASLRAGSNRVDEIDLYDDLMAFSDLSPEEQKKESASYESMREPIIEQSSYSVEDSPFELPDEPTKKKSDYLDLNYLLRVTGPLAAFASTANADSSQFACRDCGGQASSADLFCVTCGGLLDQAEAPEASAVIAIKPACQACGFPVEEDEIFCPSCGAVL